jgi:hypothetical protein
LPPPDAPTKAQKPCVGSARSTPCSSCSSRAGAPVREAEAAKATAGSVAGPAAAGSAGTRCRRTIVCSDAAVADLAVVVGDDDGAGLAAGRTRALERFAHRLAYGGTERRQRAPSAAADRAPDDSARSPTPKSDRSADVPTQVRRRVRKHECGEVAVVGVDPDAAGAQHTTARQHDLDLLVGDLGFATAHPRW